MQQEIPWLSSIEPSWTLFLDRDGVLNIEKENDYIRTKDEFVWYPFVIDALVILSAIFSKIIILTNQRGVGRGWMTEESLKEIHHYITKEITSHGGRIDAIYSCTSIYHHALCRKPNIGMALQAQKDFPHINFHKSIMVGNNLSDMQLGRNIGGKTVFLTTTKPDIVSPHSLIDIRCESLYQFSSLLKKNIA